jgi:hypothetical protein
MFRFYDTRNNKDVRVSIVGWILYEISRICAAPVEALLRYECGVRYYRKRLFPLQMLACFPLFFALMGLGRITDHLVFNVACLTMLGSLVWRMTESWKHEREYSKTKKNYRHSFSDGNIQAPWRSLFSVFKLPSSDLWIRRLWEPLFIFIIGILLGILVDFWFLFKFTFAAMGLLFIANYRYYIELEKWRDRHDAKLVAKEINEAEHTNEHELSSLPVSIIAPPDNIDYERTRNVSTQPSPLKVGQNVSKPPISISPPTSASPVAILPPTRKTQKVESPVEAKKKSDSSSDVAVEPLPGHPHANPSTPISLPPSASPIAIPPPIRKTQKVESPVEAKKKSDSSSDAAVEPSPDLPHANPDANPKVLAWSPGQEAPIINNAQAEPTLEKSAVPPKTITCPACNRQISIATRKDEKWILCPYPTCKVGFHAKFTT